MLTNARFWRLFAFFLLTTSLSVAALTWTARRAARDVVVRSIEQELYARATLLESEARRAFEASEPSAFGEAFERKGTRVDTRFTLIRPTGEVVADTLADGSESVDHANLPEVRAALGGERGVATRVGSTSRSPSIYVAIPVRDDTRVLGVVRASIPLDSVDASLSPLDRRLARDGLLVMALATLWSLWLSRRLSGPIRELAGGAERIAGGELELRVPVAEDAEIGRTAIAVNRMATSLREKAQAALRADREKDLVLSSLSEGVVMVDHEGRVTHANPAATDLLGPIPSGVPLAEPGLGRLAKRTISAGTSQEEEIATGLQASIDARGTPLRDSFDRTTGALLVLNDRSRIRRLENVRRDFAAHASHELKTPLSAIQGFADTLLQGALGRPEDAERFVRVIAEQASRLQRLIEGLMDLARLERSVEEDEIVRKWHHLSEILGAVVASAETDASARGVRLKVECPEKLAAQVNATLLERAVGNLVDNAIRHSLDRGQVRISASEDENEVVLEVADDGEGIDEADLERVFERFYRGARTRGLHPAGSGLGLAIVKHIALAHGGSVSVRSPPGSGSTFRLRIPKY